MFVRSPSRVWKGTEDKKKLKKLDFAIKLQFSILEFAIENFASTN